MCGKMSKELAMQMYVEELQQVRHVHLSELALYAGVYTGSFSGEGRGDFSLYT